MIDFSFGEEEKILEETVRNFAKDKINPRGKCIVEREITELGLRGIEFPESVGGQGMKLITRGIVLKTMAQYGDAGITYLIFSFLPLLYALEEFGGEKGKEYMKAIISGEKNGCILKCGIYENTIKTQVKINNGKIYGKGIIEKEGLIGIFFNNGSIGFGIIDGIGSKREIMRCGLENSPTFEVEFQGENIEVLCEDVFAKNWDRFTSRILAFLSSILVGLSKCASRYALEYALERVAFGKPIAYHQAISSMLADMETFSEGAENMLWKALSKEEKDDIISAFINAVETAKKVSQDAVQILGGHGYITDHPTEKWMRDVMEISIAFGDWKRWLGKIKNMSLDL